jgi:hypothetical protein
MWMGGTLVFKNTSRFQKWSKILGKDSREHEEARDARIDHSSSRKCPPATPGEEFRRTFAKLRSAARFLREKLVEIAGEPGWEELVRRASEIHAQWAYLRDKQSGPLPSYEDFLMVKREYDKLAGVYEALFDPKAAAPVYIALSELRELREKYGECKSDHSQQDAERQAQELLATCERIKDAEHNLDLLFEVSAFDTHYDRYYDETQGRG